MMNIKEIFARLTGGLTEGLKLWAVQLVIEAEKNLPGATGAEKRANVIRRLDETVRLPWYAEPFDGPAFGLLVDMVCEKLNLLTDKDIASVTPAAAKKAASLLEVDSNEIKAASGLSVDERIEALYRKYGIK